MRIWSILLNKSDLKWRIHLRIRRFFIINYLCFWRFMKWEISMLLHRVYTDIQWTNFLTISYRTHNNNFKITQICTQSILLFDCHDYIAAAIFIDSRGSFWHANFKSLSIFLEKQQSIKTNLLSTCSFEIEINLFTKIRCIFTHNIYTL